jgi:hypothetical protein
MFASMWKVIVQRWLLPGELREATVRQVRQRGQGSGEADAARVSAMLAG